jgi:DHA2 family multidrug resistance protein
VIGVLVLQGVGFSFLFVPLATAALSFVPRTQLADATGLNSVVRQFGGSSGLAIYGTLLAQYGARARADLGEYVTIYRPEVTARVATVTQAFMMRGMDAASARAAAIQVLSGMVSRQAAVIAFERVFALTGLVLACTLPLVLLLRRGDHDDHPGTKHPAEA